MQRKPRLSIAIALLGMLMLGGCVTKTREFAGHAPDAVWSAMIVAARTPDYSDPDPTERWTVRENEVWVDQDTSRIEVFRRLERMLHLPGSRPRFESRSWKFQIVLAEQDPPTVSFRVRNTGVPAHAWDEAKRYFAEVGKALGEESDEHVDSADAEDDAGSTDDASSPNAPDLSADEEPDLISPDDLLEP